MSSSSLPSAPPTPPTPPAAPRTPPMQEQAKVLPTPPSFSRRMAASPAAQGLAHKGHTRNVSFTLDESSDDDGPKLYRIPQRQPDSTTSAVASTATPHSAPASTARRSAPLPLNLPNKPPRGVSSSISPLIRGPPTAPASRLSTSASARGLSITPTLAKGPRGAGGSIWSANPTNTSGWISPALNSARSVGSTARQRGLTVAVLTDSKEMLVGDVPLTPGLSTGNPLKSASLIGSAPFNGAAIPEEKEGDSLSPGQTAAKHDVVILCRYYHTPGLTCTSRPCRFVHNLETIKSPNPVDSYEMMSPNKADPTVGTFAQAQMSAQAKILKVDELVSNGAAPGETVVLSNGEGHEVVGTVYLMSGGGKGPAGKSRAKFKTVPCKDYAAGTCPYGDYCSFIHDEKLPEEKENEGQSESDASANRRHSTGASTKPLLDAWTQNLPRSHATPGIAVDTSALDKHQKRLSAFAPPYTSTPLLVGTKGEVVPKPPIPRLIDAPALFKPKAPPIKTSAWAKGPPIALKKVSIVEPSTIPSPSSHLAPPASAVSMFGTESDPATPWDPAMRRKFEPDLQEASYESLYTPPSPFPSPPSYTHGSWGPASYPWGMPMSPISPLDESDPLSMIPGGPGVIWTPAGWAVQDAAMKHSLRAAEIKARMENANTRAKAKSYYKTRQCKFYLEGNCPHGDHCTYSHSDTAARPPFKRLNVKILPCKFFNSASGCSNGADCDFLHKFVVPPSVPLVDKPRPWRTKPCRHYQLGRCHLGDACHFAHVPDPTHRCLDTDRICRHWLKGRCEKGNSCKFRHEEEQLTEERLNQAFEAMRLKQYKECSDGEDDDVEIVTNGTSFSPAQSIRT